MSSREDGPIEKEQTAEVYEEPEEPSTPIQESIGMFLRNSFIWAIVIIILLVAVLVGVFGTEMMALVNSVAAQAGQ